MANYSFHKGKYGGATGTIYPFMRTLPEGVDTNQGEWKLYVPAGYLRCDGSVLSADQFPQLAKLLGIGNACIYKKENVELDEQVNGVGGTFQIPDLGSKFITGGTASGSYLNLFIENAEGEQVRRVGVEVELESAIGRTVNFSYSGSFSFPQTPITFSGNFAPTISSRAEPSNVFDVQMLPHGHHSTTSYPFQGPNTHRLATSGGAQRCCADISLAIESVAPGGSDSSTSHSHFLQRLPITNDITGTMIATTIPASELETTVSVNTDDTREFPDIVPAYILVEYLIKV